MSLINIKIEGYPYQVEEGLTILEAAKRCGYEIPSLCAYNHGECLPRLPCRGDRCARTRRLLRISRLRGYGDNHIFA